MQYAPSSPKCSCIHFPAQAHDAKTIRLIAPNPNAPMRSDCDRVGRLWSLDRSGGSAPLDAAGEVGEFMSRFRVEEQRADVKASTPIPTHSVPFDQPKES